MKRTYFLAGDVSAAKRVVDELLLAHVEARYIHVLAKRGTPLPDLPEANLLQKIGNTRLRRFEPAIERGEVLVIADVPRERVDEIEARVSQHVPQARVEGIEPLVPPFP